MTRKMQDGLTHKYPGISDAVFFELIDSTGGWPVGYKYVGFEHTDERAAGFCNSPGNDGWWTVVAHSDDYYMWKLSPAGIQRIAAAVLRRASGAVIQANCDDLRPMNYRGREATLQLKEVE